MIGMQILNAVVTVKYMFNILLTDAKTFVFDTDTYIILARLTMDVNFGVFWRILYGVT
jgi:hypothetical protein